MKQLLVQLYRQLHFRLAQKAVKYKFLRKINHHIIIFLKSNYAEVKGHRFYLDPTDSLRLSTRGGYDFYLTEIMKENVKEGDVVLDIGAHIGYHTLTLAKLVGKTGRVFAFEPHPDNFALLKKNVEINGYNNVVLEQKAVSSHSGKIKLFLDKNASTKHSFRKNKGCSEDFVEVDSVCLDDYFSRKKIDFLKIDVEGAEYGVFQTMPALLKRSSNLKIITEYSPSYLDSSEDLVKLLESSGFKLYGLNERKKTRSPFYVDHFKEYLANRVGSEVNINLFCVKA